VEVTETGQDVLRRYFLAIATGEYDDPSWISLDVASEVAEVVTWLCAPELGADRVFRQYHPELAANPSEDDIRRVLRPPPRDWNQDTAAFVFVTGHGESDDEHQHWTILEKTEWGKWASTALRTSDLIGWLHDSGIEQLVLVLDMCSAGDVLRQVAGRKTNIGEKYAAADPYLTVDAFVRGVQDKLGDGQNLNTLPGRLSRMHLALPNPHYRPQGTVHTETRRAELALPVKDLQTHWDPRSRGVASGEEPGWLFTGRSRLMRALIDAAGGSSGVTLVTGSAGSGKSAALARLVTLSDPKFRADHSAVVAEIPAELLPAAGLVDAAVVATGKTSADVFGQLREAFGIEVPSRPTMEEVRRAWAQWTATLRLPITIVIDALDEAASPADLVEQVLTYLADVNGLAPMVRLLVGVRSPGRGDGTAELPIGRRQPLAEQVGEKLGASRIAVDEAPWWDEIDVVNYAANILLKTPGSPYRADQAGERRAVELAGVLGEQVGRSFLVTRIAAVSLAGRSYTIDRTDERWNQAITNGVRGVFRDDLHAIFAQPEDRERAVELLRGLAFAEGPGLPWFQVWPTVTNAVANGPTYGDQDIVWLLQTRLGAYVIIDHEDDMPVYRLFHHFLRDTLREDWRDLLTQPYDGLGGRE
jgi:hypothetical protein